MKTEIKVFAPATVSNVGCGFDILGFAMEGMGDTITVRKSDKKGITITKIIGADLPLSNDKNVAGIAGMAMLKHLNYEGGFEVEIAKGIAAGSGLGSSASSSAGVVVAINELLDSPYSPSDLVEFAMEGEVLASGKKHADNVAPCICGGFVLISGYEPLDLTNLEYPKDMHCTVLHPAIEIKTIESRKLLPNQIPLEDAVKQWGNVAGLVTGLYKHDFGLISRSMQDVVAEPNRSTLIPGFDAVKKAAIDAGAVGCSISGSGPTIFALSKNKEESELVTNAMKVAYDQVGVEFSIYVSQVNQNGVTEVNS
jgi:homoserine kinase